MKDNVQEEAASNGYQAEAEKEADALFDPINQNVETIANIHRRLESDINRHQRAIERITAFLGRPLFLYLILSLVILWIVANILLVRIGLRGFDPAPFTWLLEIINVSSLLMTTVVLITQNRQNRVTEQRRHLDLQVNLLVEQKVTKIIAMLEDLRKDLPSVEHQHDPEVEVMKESVDPHAVLVSLNQMLGEAANDRK